LSVAFSTPSSESINTALPEIPMYYRPAVGEGGHCGRGDKSRLQQPLLQIDQHAPPSREFAREEPLSTSKWHPAIVLLQEKWGLGAKHNISPKKRCMPQPTRFRPPTDEWSVTPSLVGIGTTELPIQSNRSTSRAATVHQIKTGWRHTLHRASHLRTEPSKNLVLEIFRTRLLQSKRAGSRA
jgi:hypothetical protein